MTPALWAGAGLCLLAVGRAAAAQKHPLLAVLGGAVCGLAALALVNLFAPYTGVTLPLNRFTGFAATVLGLPGVTCLLVLNLIFSGAL